MNSVLIVGSRRSRFRRFDRPVHSTARWEFAEHLDHNHQRWQVLHSPSVGLGIEQEIEEAVHRIRLVGEDIGLETAG
jgi:hypothetical protein